MRYNNWSILVVVYLPHVLGFAPFCVFSMKLLLIKKMYTVFIKEVIERINSSMRLWNHAYCMVHYHPKTSKKRVPTNWDFNLLTPHNRRNTNTSVLSISKLMEAGICVLWTNYQLTSCSANGNGHMALWHPPTWPLL